MKISNIGARFTNAVKNIPTKAKTAAKIMLVGSAVGGGAIAITGCDYQPTYENKYNKDSLVLLNACRANLCNECKTIVSQKREKAIPASPYCNSHNYFVALCTDCKDYVRKFEKKPLPENK